MMYSNVTEMIGNTPLVRLNSYSNDKIEIYAKLEKYNPGGSVKDRIALSMIEHAEKTGELNKDKIILEATSGNTGIGIAIVGKSKGYKVLLTMPDNVSPERRQILRAFGAEVVCTPGEYGTDGAILTAKELSKDPKYFMPFQFGNEYNWKAHFKTAEEIWKDTNGKVTHIVAGLGTTGTAMGLSRKLKELNPNIKIIGVEPYPKHKIQGLKSMTDQIKPEIYNEKVLDQKIMVKDKNAFQTLRDLVKKEQLLMGLSSGAALWGALETAKQINEGVIVVIFPDGGEKYLSTDVYAQGGCE